MDAVAQIHRFLGESLVTVALVGLLLSLFAKAPNGGVRRVALVLGRIFGVLISLQWLLGVINYFGMAAELRPSIWHPIVMTVMVAGFHMYFNRLRKAETSSQWPLTAAFLGAWLLIVVGMRFVA